MSTVARVLLATGLVLGGSGCAKTDWIDRTLVTVDVTGVWTGDLTAGPYSAPMTLDLEQRGSTVRGSVRFTGGASVWGIPSGPIDGTVTGDVLRFRQTRGDLGGELTVSGDEMTGLLTSSLGGSSRGVLRRSDPSSPPGSPPR